MQNQVIEQKHAPWHVLAEQEVWRELQASPEGLTSHQARERLAKAGPNSLETDEGISPLQLLVRQIHNPLIYLLLAAAALSLVAGDGIDAAVILGVIVLNSLLGFVQEWRAEGALLALRRMGAPHARVLRDGEAHSIAASEVVPGDLLLLETGDRVPADARLLFSDELHLDESALTGESEPVLKEPRQVAAEAPVAERTNMVWMSTVITAGRGRAVVVETGMRTQLGKIAGEVRTTEREETPLQKRIGRLGLIMGVAGISLAAVVFLLGLLRGYEIIEMLLFAVATAVSAVPEGLPAVISVTLALGVQRMARRRAIIRRLPAVETLGSTTVICTDKTGTITENQMTVRKVWAGGQIWDVTGEGYQPSGELKSQSDQVTAQQNETLRLLLHIGAVANNAHLRQVHSEWRVEGNPSEGALLAVALKAGLEPDTLREQQERLHEIPFSSKKKYMATLHPEPGQSRRVAYVKGAPDRLLAYCNQVLIDGQPVALTDQRKRELEQVIEGFAAQALRVLAGAYRSLPEEKNKLQPEDVQGGLTLTGLWASIDPPRAESVAAVAEARAAGIRPVMITGDHAVTATAIAKQVGITQKDHALSGRDIEQMEQSRLADAALDVGVFARVSPADKLTILQSLKGRGEIVAMTGDGVNDAPALKNADIGIAMGITGTEVAKEAADMVLTDDNFATIVHAVEEGRIIYDNLLRVIFFLLATNLGEIVTLIGALLIGMELPLTAIMILWVNLVTDGACTIPLGVEPRHHDVLKLPPRTPGEPIISKRLLFRMLFLIPVMAVGTLSLFWYELSNGSLEHARTVAFTTLAAFQWFQAFNARSPRQSVFAIGPASNRWLLLGVGVAIVLQLLVVYTPLGHLFFGTVPLNGFDWILIILVASSIWVADELLKKAGVYDKVGRRSRVA